MYTVVIIVVIVDYNNIAIYSFFEQLFLCYVFMIYITDCSIKVSWSFIKRLRKMIFYSATSSESVNIIYSIKDSDVCAPKLTDRCSSTCPIMHV